MWRKCSYECTVYMYKMYVSRCGGNVVINVQCTSMYPDVECSYKCTVYMYVPRCGGNVVINVQCTCMYPDVEEM